MVDFKGWALNLGRNTFQIRVNILLFSPAPINAAGEFPENVDYYFDLNLIYVFVPLLRIDFNSILKI